MQTKVDQISDRIYRLSTWIPDIGPGGFTFNQFLVDAEEPLLYHTGMRQLFPLVKGAVEQVMPVSRLRWIAFAHLEADECGAMNEFLVAAPHAQVAHGLLGCRVSLGEMASRPPVPLADGEVVTLGAKRIRHIDTPHLPHGWDARVLFEETTATLLCGDLFTHFGDGPALTSADITGPAARAEDLLAYSCLAPGTPATLERLAGMAPQTLALMHGSSFSGDCAGALRALAADHRDRIAAACS